MAELADRAPGQDVDYVQLKTGTPTILEHLLQALLAIVAGKIYFGSMDHNYDEEYPSLYPEPAATYTEPTHEWGPASKSV
mgnify:CR=1 FL=1